MALPGDLASDGSFKRNFSRRWYRENFSRVRPRETFHCCGVVGHTCRTGPSTAETDRRVHAAAAEIQLVPWRQTSRRPPRGLAGRARLWRGTRAVSLLSGVNRGQGTPAGAGEQQPGAGPWPAAAGGVQWRSAGEVRPPGQAPGHVLQCCVVAGDGGGGCACGNTEPADLGHWR